MIDWVEAHAASKWREWTGRGAKRLHIAALSSSRHERSRLTFLIGDGLRPPAVAVKLTRSQTHRRQIIREYQILSRAHHELPSNYVDDVPKPLELVESPVAVAMYTEAVPGRRAIFPPLLAPVDRWGMAGVDKYLVGVLRWSAELSRATRHVVSSGDPVGDNLKELVRGTSAEDLLGEIPPYRSWQHCDPALGNVLVGRRMRLIDWEHASPNSLPWHDLAYVVLSMVLLAAHQSNSHPIEAFNALYYPSAPFGTLIRRRVTEAWQHSTGIAGGVTITALELAAQRTDANGAWHDLAQHLLSGAGPAWLRI